MYWKTWKKSWKSRGILSVRKSGNPASCLNVSLKIMHRWFNGCDLWIPKRRQYHFALFRLAAKYTIKVNVKVRFTLYPWWWGQNGCSARHHSTIHNVKLWAIVCVNRPLTECVEESPVLHKWGNPLWPWNPELTSPAIQYRGISDPTKRLISRSQYEAANILATGFLNQLTSRRHIMIWHFGRVLCIETVTFFTKNSCMISGIFDSRDKKDFCTIQFSNSSPYFRRRSWTHPRWRRRCTKVTCRRCSRRCRHLPCRSWVTSIAVGSARTPTRMRRK